MIHDGYFLFEKNQPHVSNQYIWRGKNEVLFLFSYAEKEKKIGSSTSTLILSHLTKAIVTSFFYFPSFLPPLFKKHINIPPLHRPLYCSPALSLPHAPLTDYLQWPLKCSYTFEIVAVMEITPGMEHVWFFVRESVSPFPAFPLLRRESVLCWRGRLRALGVLFSNADEYGVEIR